MWVVGDLARDSQAALDGRPVQHLVSLVSVEDDATGEELEVIWEIEPGTRVIERAELYVDRRRTGTCLRSECQLLATTSTICLSSPTCSASASDAAFSPR